MNKSVEKIRVLTINCVYDKGSTGKIIVDTAKVLSDKCEFIFCYESGPKSNKNKYRIAGKYEFCFYYMLARLIGLKYSTGFTSTARLLRFIKKQKPDVVHLHCPNINTVNIPWLISFLKKKNIPTVITNHAEFYYTGNCPHAYECEKFKTGCGNCNYVFDPYRKYLFDRTAYEWKRMKNAFDGFDNAVSVSVSPWVMSRQLMSPIMKNITSVVIRNGIDTENVFYHRETDICRRFNIPENKKLLLQVTANFTDAEGDIKGGRYIIELAKKMPDMHFLVAGSNRIEKPEQLPKNLQLLGSISDQNELAELYSAADLTILTSRRETYGMAVAESLCCGTPVVGFKAGGPESITLEKYSNFVEYGDIDALQKSIATVLKLGKIPGEEYETVKNIYSSRTMAEGYFNIYNGFMGV